MGTIESKVKICVKDSSTHNFPEFFPNAIQVSV